MQNTSTTLNIVKISIDSRQTHNRQEKLLAEKELEEKQPLKVAIDDVIDASKVDNLEEKNWLYRIAESHDRQVIDCKCKSVAEEIMVKSKILGDDVLTTIAEINTHMSKSGKHDYIEIDDNQNPLEKMTLHTLISKFVSLDTNLSDTKRRRTDYSYRSITKHWIESMNSGK